ncbi:MAG: Ig-like domain-containing protein [Sneathiellales bacterium]|nr:Ig-like domain-containing protein [Sneathiellales bacterium]
MRVIGILVTLLVLAAGALFFFLDGEEKETAEKVTPKTPAAPATDQAKPAQKIVTGKADEPKVEPPKVATEKAQEAASADKPEIVIKPKTGETSKASGLARMVDPAFDIVRVDENCGLLAAGTAEPTSMIQIFAGEKLLGKVQTNRRGEWIFLTTHPLEKGAQKINAIATNPDGKDVETDRYVIMQVPDCAQQIDKREPAIALLAPKEKAGKEAFDKRVSKLLQVPEPKGNLESAKDLSVGSVDYDDKGNVALSGKAKDGNSVRVYLENKLVGTAEVGKDGEWSLQPEKDIDPGTYTLRADQVDDQGKVISRVEIPFQREAADDVILAKGGIEIQAVVQPGNSLWRIARRMYGKGTHYTTIYQANQSQIKDPDLIYPGQIFKLPENASN